MSIIDPIVQPLKNEKGEIISPLSDYQPNSKVQLRIAQILKSFAYGHNTLYKPRTEFNDLSLLGRMTADQLAFNTYQPNDGFGWEGDPNTSWRSRAIRPVIRNKVISIAAHATARLIFPKIFACDEDSDAQKEAAQVMEDLMEWAADQSNYARTSLYSVIAALVNPAAIVYTEYSEVYKNVKTEKKEDGTWETKKICDEIMSGFQDVMVPIDELYISNIYEHNIQKQDWLIWRRVQMFELVQEKYKEYENFKYVKPGVQVIFNDANQTFYETYDSNLRSQECEEIIFWHRTMDLKVIMVNGVMLTDPDNPNPRVDKLYPFAKFGFELIDEGRFFYYKSLVFKATPDARIINTLYPMIIDGTYLSIMPPMVAIGSETIGSDVIIPGAVTTLSSPDADLKSIKISENIASSLNTLAVVERSMDESTQNPIEQGQQQPGETTAYEISRLEQNAATVLGLFVKMIGEFVKEYGRLRLDDILQYLTIADASKIEQGDEDLLYKTFLLPDKMTNGKMKNRKIKFDIGLPTGMISPNDIENLSFQNLTEQGGPDSEMELYKVNPELFRNLKYTVKISPDILNPMSEDLERAFMLEEYDRAIQNPTLDQQQVTRDFLLGAYPKSKKNPDKYFIKQNPADQFNQMMQPRSIPGMPGGSPLDAMSKMKGVLPQGPTVARAGVNS